MKHILKAAKSHNLLQCVVILCLAFITSCQEDEEPVAPVPETGTVIDIDGNEYKTIKIGNQWWMAENLKVKTFSDGTLLYEQPNEADWINANQAYCIYEANDDAPGLLYNYAAVNSANKLAPQGWHIPTDEEWKTLEIHLGMSLSDADKLAWRGSNQGEKLKIKSPEGWSIYESVWNTNESGFTALAGSCRLANGKWGNPGLFCTGFWWTATGHSSDDAFYRYLDYKNANVFRSNTSKQYGMSVRCVKD